MIEAPILAATLRGGSTMGPGIPPAASIEDPKRLALAWAGCRVDARAPSGIFFSPQLTLIARRDRGVESPHQGRPGGDIPRCYALLEARSTHNVAQGGSRIAKLNRGWYIRRRWGNTRGRLSCVTRNTLPSRRLDRDGE